MFSGPLRLYRVRGSAAFLNSGKMVHPILTKSQCWCVDGEGKFVLRVRNNTYWRIELPYDNTTNERLAIDLKRALPQVLQYETTACPFQRAFHVELPISSPTIKRPWKPRQLPSGSVVDGSPSHTEAPSQRLGGQDLPPDPSTTKASSYDPQFALPRTLHEAGNDDAHSLDISEDSTASVEQHVSAYERLSAADRTSFAEGAGILEPTPCNEITRAPESPDGKQPGGSQSALSSRTKTSDPLELQRPSQAPVMTAGTLDERLIRSRQNADASENEGGLISSQAAARTDRNSPILAEPLRSGPLKGAETDGLRWPDYSSDSSTPTQTMSGPEIQVGNGSLRSDLEQQPMPTSAFPSRLGPTRVDCRQDPEAETNSISSSIDSFYSLTSPISVSSAASSSPYLPAKPSPKRNTTQLPHMPSCNQEAAEGGLLEDLAVMPDEVEPTLGETDVYHEPCLKPAGASAILEDEYTHINGVSYGERSPSAPSVALRQRFKSRRHHSPPPEPANLYLPTTRTTGSYLTSHILQKTCNLLLGPPVQIVALMLNLAARIANGALAAGPFTYDASGQPIPCSWNLKEDETADDETADDEWDDDFFSLNGPGGTKSSGSSSWEVD